MKILALNGSHRGAAGLTQWLLDKLAEGAAQAGGQFETIVLADHKITPCAGCEACRGAGQASGCIHGTRDDVAAIFAKMRAADILIYATPVYIFGLTGLMKTFLDRFNATASTGQLVLTDSGLLFGRVDKAIYSKPTVVLTCCGNVEPETVKNVTGYFRTFARFLDAPLVGILARRSVGMLAPVKAGEPPANAAVAAVVGAYIQAGRELAAGGKITAATEKAANQNILGVPCLDLMLKFRFIKKLILKRNAQPKSP